MRVYRGTFVNPLNDRRYIDFLRDHIVGVQDGTIAFVEPASRLGEMATIHGFNPESDVSVFMGNQFFIPGMIDTHIHAPQYAFTGTATSCPLMEWLEKFTYPTESRFSDLGFAEQVYSKLISRLLKNGCTTGLYYATIHNESSLALARCALRAGQRAFIGKVAMDRNAPDHYRQATATAIEETERFILDARQLNSGLTHPLVEPVVTPRFIPTCTSDLMSGLAALAAKHHCLIQTHAVESIDEVAFVKSLHDAEARHEDDACHCSGGETGCLCERDIMILDKLGLLKPGTVLAHAVHLKEEEAALIKERGAAISHCPLSNYFFSQGVLPLRRCLDWGVTVGLGTDVAGGYAPSLLTAIRETVVSSRTLENRELQEGRVGGPRLRSELRVTWREALWLATMGGAQSLMLANRLGSFAPGKLFDAVLVDPQAPGSPFDVFIDAAAGGERPRAQGGLDTLEDIVEKYVNLGDDRNHVAVWVQGREVVAAGGQLVAA